MKFVVIPTGDGYQAHENIDPEKWNLSDNAEIYDDREAFETRLSDFETE